MCLAIPAEIISIDNTKALVDFGGTRREVDVSLVEVNTGDYVIVHAGFAIKVMQKDNALETLDLFREILAQE